MKDEKYDVLCTEPDTKCSGYYKGYCISIENCQYQKPVLTNYERIKKMSVEEMASFMANHLPVSFDCACDLEPLCGDSGKFNDCCVNAFYKWLNEESKE